MHFISTSDLLGPDWTFLEPVCNDPDLTWETHSGLPRNLVERIVRRPAIGRWRAALTAVLAARKRQDAVLVSHLPLMAAVTNLLRRALCPGVPQVAFALNFTDRPGGLRRAFLRRALRGIEEFVVFSTFERPLYAAELGIPEDRIRFLPWAMEAPRPGADSPVSDLAEARRGYICAIGGEGRDYALLAEVMRHRPEQQMVVVARPYSIEGVEFPSNVRVFTNLPSPVTWRIAADSRGLAIPLKTEETACGHITLVAAQLLGLPLIVTRSRGVADYVEDGATAQVVAAGDAAALGQAIDRIGEDPVAIDEMASQAQKLARARSSLSDWIDYLRNFAESRLGK